MEGGGCAGSWGGGTSYHQLTMRVERVRATAGLRRGDVAVTRVGGRRGRRLAETVELIRRAARRRVLTGGRASRDSCRNARRLVGPAVRVGRNAETGVRREICSIGLFWFGIGSVLLLAAWRSALRPARIPNAKYFRLQIK